MVERIIESGLCSSYSCMVIRSGQLAKPYLTGGFTEKKVSDLE